VRDTLIAIGRGATIVGLLFVLAGGAHPWLLLAGKALIGRHHFADRPFLAAVKVVIVGDRAR
jgi:hypothetical protein